MKPSKRKPKTKPAAESPKPRTVFLTEFSLLGVIRETGIDASRLNTSRREMKCILAAAGGDSSISETVLPIPASMFAYIQPGQRIQITVKVFET